MFARLSLQSGFETPCAGVDDEDGEVGLAGAGDHVGNEVAVARGVKDGEVCKGGREGVGCYVDCYPATAFFRALV